MEKRDLEIAYYDLKIGAFEDVTNLTVNEDGDSMTFDSKDGSFIYKKDAKGVWVAYNRRGPRFTSYKLQVRRTTKKHLEKAKARKC